MSKNFQVICCDCPWAFSDALTMGAVSRGAASNYATMTNQDLIDLPVGMLADPAGCLLALWVPSSLLQTGLDVMKAWGFHQKTSYVWVKTKKEPFKDKPIDLNTTLAFGMGRTFRAAHEICLIGINNTGIYKQLENKSQRSVSLAENLGHSTKPENLQNSLELMFPMATTNGTALEMFARRERKGWVCVGNETGNKEDIRLSLQTLIDG
jgi:N6-adenosine-specific RNA methylase IME4